MGGLLKEMLPLGTRPLAGNAGQAPVPILRHVLEAGVAARVDEIVIVTSSAKAAALMEVVDSFELGLPIAYVFQREPSGLGDAVFCAASHLRRHDATLLNMPDVVLSPGDAGRRALRALGDGAVAAVTLHRVAQPERFGVARVDENRLVGFVDKPTAAPSEWVWSSAAFTPHFLRYLEHVRPAAGEWGLTEALDAAAAVGAVSPVFIEDGWFHDVGTYEGYLAALDEVHRTAPR